MLRVINDDEFMPSPKPAIFLYAVCDHGCVALQLFNYEIIL